MLLRFRTSDDRSAFIERLATEAPDLSWQAKPSFAQPDVLIMRPASSEEEARIIAIAGPHATSFEDVQFRVPSFASAR